MAYAWHIRNEAIHSKVAEHCKLTNSAYIATVINSPRSCTFGLDEILRWPCLHGFGSWLGRQCQWRSRSCRRRGREAWTWKLAENGARTASPPIKTLSFPWRDVRGVSRKFTLQRSLATFQSRVCTSSVQSKKVEMTTERWSCFDWLTTNSFEFYRYYIFTYHIRAVVFKNSKKQNHNSKPSKASKQLQS